MALKKSGRHAGAEPKWKEITNGIDFYASFTGYFEVNDGKTLVSYYVPVDICEHLNKRDFRCETDEDIIDGCIDRVSNIGPLKSVMEVWKMLRQIRIVEALSPWWYTNSIFTVDIVHIFPILRREFRSPADISASKATREHI